MELELIDASEEIADIRRARGDVKLCAGVEVAGAARGGRRDALVLSPEVPPGRVVVGRCDSAGEDLPAPFVDEEAERQKRHLVERHLYLLVDARAVSGLDAVEKADRFQVLGRHAER